MYTYTAPQFFHSKQKHCSSTNPILIHHLLPSSLPVSTPSTVYHSRLTVCLPDSGFDPLPIDFVWNKRLWIIWFPRLHFCGRCRNLEFTITIPYIDLHFLVFYFFSIIRII